MSNYTITDINYEKSFDFKNVDLLVSQTTITIMSRETKGEIIASFPSSQFFIVKVRNTNGIEYSTYTMD
jgi:hypothetical protein